LVPAGVRAGRAAARLLSGNNLAFLALIVAVVVYPFAFPGSRNLSLGATIGADTILALGLAIVASFAGQLSLAQAAFAALGGYTFAILTVKHGLPYGAAVAAALVVPTVAAYTLGHVLARLRSFYLAMGTLAFAELVTLVASSADWTGGSVGIPAVPLPQLGPITLIKLSDTYWYIWAVAIVCVLIALLILTSPAGRALNALKSDPVVAGLLGHDPGYWKRGAFALSGLFGGVGGVLLAQMGSFVNPDLYSTHFGIILFVMLVVGGWRSIWGAPVGALIVTSLPILLQGYQQYADVAYAVLVLLVLVLLPNGVVGIVEAAARWLSTRAGHLVEAPADRVRAERLRPALRSLAHDDSDQPVLSVRNVTRRFGGVVAVHDVSFDVHRGEVLAIIGPNGAGKTTLFNVITGLTPTETGDIQLRGSAIVGWSPDRIARAGIARTLQTPRLFPDLTVVENVMLALDSRQRMGWWKPVLRPDRSWGQNRACRQEALDFLDEAGLVWCAEKLPRTLPFAILRRLEVVRAAAVGPDVLLLDEPGAGLSGQELAGLVGVIAAAARQIAVVWIEHHLELVLANASRILVLDHGSCLTTGTPAEILADSRVQEAYIGVGPAAVS
jgi:branched-chain amino acid transport system permease protein